MLTESKAMKFIKVQCNILDLNPKALYEQSKTLLLFYQHVIWAVKSRAVDLRKEITGTYGMELNTALIYLSDLAPTATRSCFEAQVNHLFEDKWLIELADIALRLVNNYPLSGEEYTRLLQLRFMDGTPRTDTQVAEVLTLERSTYYERKKEAILLFGISLWGFFLPTSLTTYERVSNLGMKEEKFFDMISGNLSQKISS